MDKATSLIRLLRLTDKSNGWKITNVSSSHCCDCVSISCGGKRRKNGGWEIKMIVRNHTTKISVYPSV